MAKILDLLEAVESRIPKAASESWDNVGLICGDANQAFRGAVIGVDLTQALVAQAITQKANLIVIHHPPFFPKGRGISKLVLGRPNELNTLMLRCFQKNICVLVAHTNFDRCALDGMIRLAHDLGGEAQARVWEAPEAGDTLLKKLVTYIPADHFDEVRDALYAVGCGHIGNYDSCGFAMSGLGNFRPLKGSKPKIGKVGELEEVEEVRFETLVVAGMEGVVVETLKSVHPYEEVAYDLIPVEQTPAAKGMVWGMGYGFIATLDKPVAYELFVKKVKSVFKVKNFLTNQHTPKLVKKIAFTPGKGASFVKSVKAQAVDVYITGEVGYHASLEAERSGFNIMELGHRESEHYFLKTFEAWFKEWGLSASVLDERTQRIL